MKKHPSIKSELKELSFYTKKYLGQVFEKTKTEFIKYSEILNNYIDEENQKTLNPPESKSGVKYSPEDFKQIQRFENEGGSVPNLNEKEPKNEKPY